MSHPSPSPAFEQDTMSVSSELRPQLTSLKEEGPEEELNSLSNLAEEAISFVIPTDDSNNDHIGLECPTNCPCVCHLPSPLPVVNEYRPSVIMVPVAREHGNQPSVTHFPIAMQSEGNLAQPSKKTPRRKPVNKVSAEKRKRTPSTTIPRGRDNARNDTDLDERFLRVDINGKMKKFKLTRKDWELMDINEFPRGGRLLGGAWTTIFKRGVRKSNRWCSVRFTNNHVRTENSRKMHSAPFFRGTGECKREECNVKMKFVIPEERGKYVYVTYMGNVHHKLSESSVSET